MNFPKLISFQKLFSFKGYGVPEMEIKRRVIDSSHLFHLGIMILLIFLETYLLVTGITKYGLDASGVHLYRRYLYISLDIIAIIMAVIIFLLYKKRLYKAYQRVSMFIPVIIIAWGTGMSVLDCFRGNDVSVFSYTILVVAALTTNIEFFWFAGVATFFTVFLNVSFYLIPNITYTSGMRVNSIYACLLSFLMALFVSYQFKKSKAMEIKNEGLVVELEKANEKLELKSMKDGLTGLYNRMFLAKLEDGSIVNNRLPSGVMMLDVDKFKLFNDTYGHLNGDLCLKYIAEKLLQIPDSENGYSIRYGGEEFLIVYYDISKDRLMENAKHIFNSIREGAFLIDEKTEKKITVSMGVFSDIGSEHSILEMIKYADSALYNAKEQGRDRIVWECR